MPPRSDNRKELPSDATFVPRHEAEKYGYWGSMPDTSDDTQYTVTGTEESYLDASARQSSAATSPAAKSSSKKESDK